MMDDEGMDRLAEKTVELKMPEGEKLRQLCAEPVLTLS